MDLTRPAKRYVYTNTVHEGALVLELARIYSSKNMFGGILVILFFVLYNDKVNVKNVFNFVSKETTIVCLISTVFLKKTLNKSFQR